MAEAVITRVPQQLEILPLGINTRKALVKLARRLRPHRDDLVARWVSAFLNSTVCPPELSEETVSNLVDNLIDLFLDRIEPGQFDEYFADVVSLVRSYAKKGLPYNTLVLTIHLHEKTVVPILMRECRRRDDLQSALLAIDHLHHNVMALLSSTYFGSVCAGLERRNRELSALFAVATASRSLDIDVVLDNALDEVMKAMRLAAGEVLIFNPDSGRLELRAHRGLPSGFVTPNHSFGIGEGLPGLVAQKGEPILLPNLFEDERFARKLDRYKKMRCAIGIPLVAMDRVVGVMDFFGLEVLLLDEQDIKLLSSIGSQIGAAIENATLYQTVQTRSSELEEARHRREEFISMVVHEFRGPLTVLTGYTQLLNKTLRKCESCDARLPTGALAQTKRLARLVDDLSDASQIEDGRFQINKIPVDIVALARDVVEQQQTTSATHLISLDAPNEPVVGNWDADRITQVLVNLVGNAIKYSPTGGEVKVVIARRQSEVEVSVIDHGLGIAAEDIPYLFQPFSRLYRKQEIKGTGLGLYITKGILEAHGGRIAVQSASGVGSTFTLCLPFS